MNPIYSNINTFSNDIKKEELRTSVLNPLITQHNLMAVDLQNHEHRVTSLENLEHVVDLKPVTDRLDTIEEELPIIDSRLDALELLGGGEGGGNVDLSPIILRLDSAENDIDDLTTSIASQIVRIDDLVEADQSFGEMASDHASRIENLESSTGVSSPVPEKWYILPLAGQSNMWGCGEQPWDVEEKPNPRLMQLGINTSYEQDVNVNAHSSNANNSGPALTPYGDLYRLYRPVDDTNLKIIPSVPALDTIGNGFYTGFYSPVSGGVATRVHKHGNTALGHYLATALLPYIPEEYGILIVNGSRPGSGIESFSGTYDPVTMRCTRESVGLGWGSPYNQMLQDRIKYTLGLHPDNKLLPLIWMQGESDPTANGHHEKFKEYITGFKTFLTTNELHKRLPQGNIDNMKIICLGTTKVIYGTDNGFDYLSQSDYASARHAYRGRYDNYAYLMDDPNFSNPETGEGYVTYLRVDVDENGDFIETALEENRANNTLKVFSSSLDTHFSSKALKHKIPFLVVNAIGNSHVDYLTSLPRSKWVRQVPGRLGTVCTDNVRYTYDRIPDMGFDVDSDILVKMDFRRNAYTHNAPFNNNNNTITLGSSSDGKTSATFDGTANKNWYSVGDSSKTSTVSVMFKNKNEHRMTDSCILAASSSSGTSLRVNTLHGQVYVYPDFSVPTKGSALNKSSVGAWEGQWDDWQHLVLASDETLNLTNVYLNGCLIHTVHGVTNNISSLCLGSNYGQEKAYNGDVSSFRVYNKCLTSGEVVKLYLADRR